MSEDDAIEELLKIQMSKPDYISLIMFGKIEERGVWKIIYKFPKDSNFFAQNPELAKHKRPRLHFSREFKSEEFALYDAIVTEDRDRIIRDYCSKTVGHDFKWQIPTDNVMKISFHTPGALSYLKEAKTAYVYSNDTPKDMMRKIKEEAKREKEKKRFGKEG